MKKIITTAMLLSNVIAFAQTGKVGINTQNPSATLNVKSKTGTTSTTKNLQLQNANGTILASVSDDGQVKFPLLPAGSNAERKVIVVAQDGTLKLVDKASLSSYQSSNSVTISGNEIQRAALSGDVTADANSNTVIINNGVITNDKIANGTIEPSKIKVTPNENNKVLIVRNGQLVWENINTISNRDCLDYKGMDYTRRYGEGTIVTYGYRKLLCINGHWAELSNNKSTGGDW